MCVCVCVCVCVCREREREKQTDRQTDMVGRCRTINYKAITAQLVENYIEEGQ